MLLKAKHLIKKRRNLHTQTGAFIALLLPMQISLVYAAESQTGYFQSLKQGMNQLIFPEPERSPYRIDLAELSQYQLDTSQVQELPQIGLPSSATNMMT